MKLLLAICVLAACKSDKSGDKVVSEKHGGPARGSGSSQFFTNRPAACKAFAEHMQPSVNATLVDTAKAQCMNDKKLTKDQYACIMASKTVEAIAACEKTPTGGDPPAATTFETDRATACAAFAKHGVEMMSTELEKTSISMCMSDRLSEASYDCVMAAKSDADFKKCLLGP